MSLNLKVVALKVTLLNIKQQCVNSLLLVVFFSKPVLKPYSARLLRSLSCMSLAPFCDCLGKGI